MATSSTDSLLIRPIDPALKERLRVRATRNGRSVEAEARAILESALAASEPGSGAALLKSIRQRFEPLGGVELDLPERELGPGPPRFE
jgi:plasmid stability protein